MYLSPKMAYLGYLFTGQTELVWRLEGAGDSTNLIHVFLMDC